MSNTQRLTENQRLLTHLRFNSLRLSNEVQRFFDSIVKASGGEHRQTIKTQWTTLCEGYNALSSCMTLQSERFLSAARSERGLNPAASYFGVTSNSAHGLLHALTGINIDCVIAICAMNAGHDESTDVLTGDYSADNITPDHLAEIRRELTSHSDVGADQWREFHVELDAEYYAAERLVFPNGLSEAEGETPRSGCETDVALEEKALAVKEPVGGEGDTAQNIVPPLNRNDLRDEYIYQAWNRGDRWEDICEHIRSQKGWSRISTLNGIKEAGKRYASRRKLKPLIPRR